MSPLFKLPVDTLLDLWSELEQAYHGAHGFGGDTAEIYAYRLQRDCPILRCGASVQLADKAEREQAQQDYAIMRELLREFAARRDCKITVDGVPLGVWNKAGLFIHRAHVTVKPIERKGTS